MNSNSAIPMTDQRSSPPVPARGIFTLDTGPSLLRGSGELGLAPSDADHRRVLAVLRYLES